MKKILVSLLLVETLILASQGSANAICNLTQSDLTGVWQIYVTSNGNPHIEWTRVQIALDAAGNASATTAINDDTSTNTIYGGSLTVNAKCIIKGRLSVTPPGFIPALSIVINHALLNASKDTLTGVGHGPDGSPFSFTGVKR